MSGNRRRKTYTSFDAGIIEPGQSDSTQITDKSLRTAKNVRLAETGGITGRRGITSRATGVPNTNYAVFEFRNSKRHALIASDGDSIRVLESGGWLAIGSGFSTSGTRANAAMMNQRMYLVNGADRMKVLDYNGGWELRDAGVDPSTVAPTLAAVGGSGTAENDFRIAYSYVDDRGFESNVGPDANVAVKRDGTITVSALVAGGSNISFIRIYSSISNQREMFFVKEVANGTTSTSISTINLERDTAFPAPTDNNIPPDGIFSIFAHKARLYAARYETFDTYYMFSPVSEPEYWPLGNRQDLVAEEDPSKVSNFTTCSLGLMPLKDNSFMLLQFDPSTQDSPQVILQGAGLNGDDAVTTLNGIAVMLTQRGFVAHDGVRPIELWRRLPDTSDIAVSAQRVVASTKDVRTMHFFRDEDTPDVAKVAAYDMDKNRWLVDEWRLESGQATVTDSSLDFSEDADVADHENLDNGSQIQSGGGTTAITLDVAPSSKAVPGVVIKFTGFSTVYQVQTVSGADLTLDGNAPPDTTAVEYIRGTVVTSGVLTLAGA